MTGAPLDPYNPESALDRRRLVESIVRLHIAHLMQTAPFSAAWVEPAWWLAKQAEAAACRTRAS